VIFPIVEAAPKAFWAAIILTLQAALLPLQIPTSMESSRVFPLASSPLSPNNVRTMGEVVVSDVDAASVKTSLASESGSAWDCHSLWVCSSHAALVSGQLHCTSTT
jgi:hypothetical protein